MKANLKVILSGVCVAALLASPAMAKTARHHRAAPSTIYVPNDAHGSVALEQQAPVAVRISDPAGWVVWKTRVHADL